MIRLKLREFLDEHEASAYALGNTIEGISPKTVYMYVNGTRQPSLDALNLLIEALRALTGEEVEVSDILEYVPSGNA